MIIEIKHVERINNAEVLWLEAFVSGIIITFVRDRNGKITKSSKFPNKYIPPADWNELMKKVYAIFYEGDRKKRGPKGLIIKK